MRSKNPIYEEDKENTSINKTGEITILAFAGIEMTSTPRNIYTYKTGCFPVTSIKGNKGMFVLYCYGAKKMITETLKDRI